VRNPRVGSKSAGQAPRSCSALAPTLRRKCVTCALIQIPCPRRCTARAPTLRRKCGTCAVIQISCRDDVARAPSLRRKFIARSLGQVSCRRARACPRRCRARLRARMKQSASSATHQIAPILRTCIGIRRLSCFRRLDRMLTRYIPRRRPRLPGVDYAGNGAYFVTFVTDRRANVLGSVCAGALSLSPLGQLVQDLIVNVPRNLPYVRVDTFVVMPNHVHGLFWIEKPSAADRVASLTVIVGSVKSAATREARVRGLLEPAAALWQPSFYDQVIRDEGHLERIRQYIVNNPVAWEKDRFYVVA